ncbi:SDR family oxidoreductase [Arthrobacter sp. H5]|uniref:SDR family oxidoreductase n=1 Tax=Arthrobacter sp. H5 TaxID=1267973 RepID=UPI00048A0FE3|nr:SDR family oxidoreductase [Arthrobacter sp. H5]
MATDQHALADPRTLYPSISPPTQQQPEPGIQANMDPVPDLGETSYRGSGRLTGRKALITGGDSGIGGAVAIAFAREGADVAISYLPEEEEDANHIVGLIKEAGRTAVAFPGDLKDKNYCRELVEAAVTGLGGLDIVVSNAGKQVFVEKLEDISDEQFEDTMHTNVFAMFWIIKAAVPHLKPGSTIIATASLEAYHQLPFLLDYATTKGAINNFSKALAQQLAPRGIRVNAVAPGPTWTALQVTQGYPPEKLPEYGKDNPLGRSGQPAELAPAYVFLASGESSFVIGETLNVNGGMPTP